MFCRFRRCGENGGWLGVQSVWFQKLMTAHHKALIGSHALFATKIAARHLLAWLLYRNAWGASRGKRIHRLMTIHPEPPHDAFLDGILSKLSHRTCSFEGSLQISRSQACHRRSTEYLQDPLTTWHLMVILWLTHSLHLHTLH